MKSFDALMFCPATQLPREQVVIFGLKMKYGVNYLPPVGTGTVFADVGSTYWAKDWIEQAYVDGLLPAAVPRQANLYSGELVTRRGPM
ncbi:MAG: hypothetical protein IPO36_14455 [Anaerolineales bacterium]|nr:hypothetical protein [Anaerolineales bacterium]